MKTLLATLAISLAAAQSFADITPSVRWDIETGRLEPRPFTLSIRRGESLKIEPRFLSYDAPINLSGAAVEMRYATSYNMATHYSATGSVQATTGRVQIAWSDSLNPTNNSMYYEIRATSGAQILARAYGPLRFLGGMVGVNTGLVARTSLDWATVSQVNGTAVLSNQLGSGATWSGSNWTFAAGSSGISATDATNIVSGIAYPLAANPSNYVTATITNGLAGTGYVAQAVGGYVATGTLGSLAYSNSLTAADVGAATAAQGALAQATATNTLDLEGTRAMTGDSVTLARDVKSRDAAIVGVSGAAFGSNTAAGAYAAAFGYLSRAQDYGMASGEDTSAGLYGAAFGYRTVSGTNAAAFGYQSTAGDYGFSSGFRALGAFGSFVFSDYGEGLPFDRTAYTNWFSVRASGGTYFATPDLTVTGSVTATSFNGSGTNLTGITAAQVGASATGHVHDAAAVTNAPWLTNVTAAAVVAAGGVTNISVNGTLGVTSNGIASITTSPTNGYYNLLPIVSAQTCTVLCAYGERVRIQPTGTVYFTAGSCLTDTNTDATVALSLFYNNQTFGFVGATMTNTATLTSNAWNDIIFRRGYGQTILTGK